LITGSSFGAPAASVAAAPLAAAACVGAPASTPALPAQPANIDTKSAKHSILTINFFTQHAPFGCYFGLKPFFGLGLVENGLAQTDYSIWFDVAGMRFSGQ
jgi:hypothetical protein